MNKRNILKIFFKNPEKKRFKMSKLSWNIYLFFLFALRYTLDRKIDLDD